MSKEKTDINKRIADCEAMIKDIRTCKRSNSNEHKEREGRLRLNRLLDKLYLLKQEHHNSLSHR